MSVESLPKYMFLHEDSEQMKDKRIQTATFYEDVEGRVEKRYKKRVNNTFPLKKPTHSDGIFNLGRAIITQSIRINMASCSWPPTTKY